MTAFKRRELYGFVTLSLLALAPLAGPAMAQEKTAVVATAQGNVQGFVKDGVNIYLGIPYAAPPVGDLRWMPPQPAAKWDGIRDATKFAEYCPQGARSLFAGPSSVNEDCLYLNVYTTGRDASARRPVILWIPGGANIAGGAKDYDGSKLATGGPDGVATVVVTINYRLGLFGFLSESHLNAEGHPFGNYGIMDTQAALRWVRDNIAAFGGDPANVTVAGQSAGAIDATASILSPASKGLAHRLISRKHPDRQLLFRADRKGDRGRRQIRRRCWLLERGLSARIVGGADPPTGAEAGADRTVHYRSVGGWNGHSHGCGQGLCDRRLQHDADTGGLDEGRVGLGDRRRNIRQDRVGRDHAGRICDT